MHNRFLILGDSFVGGKKNVFDALANIMLAEVPERPLEFIIECNPRLTLSHLFKICPREIIGSQAGFTLFWVGWEDLKSPDPWDIIQNRYKTLLHEIRHNSETRLILCNYPTLQMEPDSIISPKIQALNHWLKTLSEENDIMVVDMQSLFDQYQHSQTLRKEKIRGLFVEDNTLSSLGQMLAAIHLARILSKV